MATPSAVEEVVVGREIERKFLVVGEGWKVAEAGTDLRQGYLCSDVERNVRVRLAGGKARLTIKGRAEGITRAEYEYDIPLDDARELLDTLCQRPLIEKTRYRIPLGEHTWEVDEFHGDNAGLVVAEVELGSADESFERPAWLGTEVSDDPRYLNANLARTPYSAWRHEVEGTGGAA